MKLILNFLIILFLLLAVTILYISQANPHAKSTEYNVDSDYVIRQQVSLDVNNIKSFIWNTGVFDQDLRTNNTPGFEWPKGTGKFALFTAGLTLGAYVNDSLRLATASYSGEYCPGYCIDSVFYTDTRFKLLSVKRTDNYINNPDWLNWGLMVPYGAPYIDANNNGTYEFLVDTPGVKGADQTVFVCLTDADTGNHHNSEGFSGGTMPLYAEVHLTAWAYNVSGLQDIQFFKWNIINKHVYSWDSTYFSITCDPDLGDANDDYVGCDTIRKMGYVYNSDDQDGTGSGISYGANPPAAGIMFLKGAHLQNTNLGASCNRVWHKNEICDHDPSSVTQAYNMIKGLKNDGTPIVIPQTNPPIITKFAFSGDPETMTGWTEYGGWVYNCGDSLTGMLVVPSPAGDRRFLMSTGAGNLIVNPGDTQTIIAAQLIARGTSNLNSVTKLKQLADVAIQLYNNGFVIGIEPISSEVPQEFKLYQNYPNPFNPTTKIKFQIPLSKGVSEGRGVLVKLIIYDILGKEVEVLINEELKPGTYEVEWFAKGGASNYSSGIYFYKLTAGDPSASSGQSFSETRKMVLLK